MDGRKCLEAQVRGIVQGVGFRPFVYRLARRHGLAGWGENTPEGVRILAAGAPGDLERFLEELTTEAPPAAVIEDLRTVEVQDPGGGELAGGDFRIRTSGREGESTVLVSPDLATCPDCLRELFDPADRRYGYPFINCTNCGPRFTIISGTPYDRPLTTMSVFTMCAACEREYHDPADRRFHAQPNACPQCGPHLWLEDTNGDALPGDPIARAAEALREGKIVAVKGLGGFQLACDATDDGAVSRLRERKRRYAKPLAVMVAGAEEAERYCQVGREERALLLSPRAPIVLLEEKEGSRLSRLVAPGLRRQGIFLPYTPLHHLLLREAGIPLVMTSGNVSEEPISKDNDEARRRLRGIADLFLLHDRDILVRYDDSVTSILEGGEYPLRRARGYAPYPVILEREYRAEVLALGPELKNTFCFLRGRHAFVSQHVGDMDDADTLRHYREAMDAIQRLFSLRPELVARDLHPDYLTTHLAEEFELPVAAVQHHHAHAVSCMADNGLTGPVIGVSWDGTGYGTDGTVWGGEFLICDEAEFERLAHLHTFPMPGGDLCARELERMAFGVLWEVYGDDAVPVYEELLERAWRGLSQGEGAAGRGAVPSGPEAGRRGEPLPRSACSPGLGGRRERETPEMAVVPADILSAQVRSGINVPFTSSAGRVFDAAAAVAGLRIRSFYEGQAACELEAAAAVTEEAYPFEIRADGKPLVIDVRPLFRSLVEDALGGVELPVMAGRFHAALAGAIVKTCSILSRETGILRVVLSGGVFQNRLLTTTVYRGLRERGLEVFLHRRVPCNDGGVSLGQAVVAATRLERGMPPDWS